MTGLEARNTGGAGAHCKLLQDRNGPEAAELLGESKEEKARPPGGNYRWQIFLIILTMVTVLEATASSHGVLVVVPGTMLSPLHRLPPTVSSPHQSETCRFRVEGPESQGGQASC